MGGTVRSAHAGVGRQARRGLARTPDPHRGVMQLIAASVQAQHYLTTIRSPPALRESRRRQVRAGQSAINSSPRLELFNLEEKWPIIFLKS